jgi:hypothetical protein
VIVAVLALDLAAAHANVLVRAKPLGAAACRVHAVRVRHALLVARGKVRADVIVATPCKTLEIEVAGVLVKLLPLQAKVRVHA